MEPFTRAEYLRALECMGIELPADTKLSDDAIEKRLRDALNFAQYKDHFDPPPDLNSLSPWTLAAPGVMGAQAPANNNPAKCALVHSNASQGAGGPVQFESKLMDACRRGNLHEARINVFRQEMQARMDELRQQTGLDPLRGAVMGTPAMHVDPFMDLRETSLCLANFADQGGRWLLLQDPETEKYAINVRILSVLELNDRTPVFVLLYRSFNSSKVMEAIAWTQEMSAKYGGATAHIRCMPLELKLFLKLLKGNAHLVPANYNFDRCETEKEYKVSVLLPVGPLEYGALAKLNSNVGCVLCGKKIVSRCKQCQSASYCSADCQRAHWPEHKVACRSIKGGRWCSIKTRSTFLIEGGFMAVLNNHSNPAMGFNDRASQTYQPNDSSPPPNDHGDGIFLVKLQVGLAPEPSVPQHMMVYDRKRSFKLYWFRSEDPSLFQEFYDEMQGPRGGYGGLKMYRWAKRTGDWELSICLDREPLTDTKW